MPARRRSAARSCVRVPVRTRPSRRVRTRASTDAGAASLRALHGAGVCVWTMRPRHAATAGRPAGHYHVSHHFLLLDVEPEGAVERDVHHLGAACRARHAHHITAVVASVRAIALLRARSRVLAPAFRPLPRAAGQTQRASVEKRGRQRPRRATPRQRARAPHAPLAAQAAAVSGPCEPHCEQQETGRGSR